MQLRTSELAASVSGRLVGPDVVVDGATQDSRAVRPGQLFVPLVAERDGHAFVAAAIEAGAGAYLTSADPLGGTTIVVADTLAALQDAGRLARTRLPAPVVGITGSVGTTSVTDMPAAVPRQRLAVAASERSYIGRAS